MKTLKQLHAEWAAKVMPATASQTQRQEMERAFYAGALAMFTNTLAIADLPEAQAERAMDAIHKEATDYFRLLVTIPGRGGPENQ